MTYAKSKCIYSTPFLLLLLLLLLLPLLSLFVLSVYLFSNWFHYAHSAQITYTHTHTHNKKLKNQQYEECKSGNSIVQLCFFLLNPIECRHKAIMPRELPHGLSVCAFTLDAICFLFCFLDLFVSIFSFFHRSLSHSACRCRHHTCVCGVRVCAYKSDLLTSYKREPLKSETFVSTTLCNVHLRF